MALQVDPDNDPSEEDEDDIDRLLKVGSKSGPSRPATFIASSSSDSSNEETPVESLKHISESLILVCSKVGAARQFIKHKSSYQITTVKATC